MGVGRTARPFAEIFPKENDFMSAELINQEAGMVTIKVSGNLRQAELVAVQQKIAKLIQNKGKVKALVLVEKFQGWAKGDNWGDVSFQMEHDNSIERMALVGERKWEDLVLAFTGAGVRPFPIEYFDDMAQARAWLNSAK
jgi:hypothetical protein